MPTATIGALSCHDVLLDIIQRHHNGEVSIYPELSFETFDDNTVLLNGTNCTFTQWQLEIIQEWIETDPTIDFTQQEIDHLIDSWIESIPTTESDTTDSPLASPIESPLPTF